MTEPELDSGNGNEVTSNGRHEAIGLGPSVEPVLGNGQHAAPLDGNGHRDEAPAPQPSLFPWASFVAARPVKSKGRRRKAQAPAQFLFERALEQERAPVGAGRKNANMGEDT